MHDLVEVDAADEEDGGEREHDEEAKPGGTDTVVNVQGLRGRREEGIRGDQGGASQGRRILEPCANLTMDLDLDPRI